MELRKLVLTYVVPSVVSNDITKEEAAPGSPAHRSRSRTRGTGNGSEQCHEAELGQGGSRRLRTSKHNLIAINGRWFLPWTNRKGATPVEPPLPIHGRFKTPAKVVQKLT
jgi:hypothetical protein